MSPPTVANPAPAPPAPAPPAGEPGAAAVEAVRRLLGAETLADPWLKALVVLAVVVLALAVAWLVDLVLTRLVRRWAARTRSDFDDRLIDMLHAPVRISIVLVGVALSAELLGLGGRPRFWVFGVLQTVAVIVWLGFALRFASLILAALAARQDRFRLIDVRTLPLLDNTAKVIVVGAGIYFVFLAWNVNVTAWLASAGIVGIAVGFAAKDTLANLFAGLFISADAPYKVGDFIVLDSGERGMVTQVGIRSTRLLTRDDVEVTIPNAVIANAKIVNQSGGPWEKQRLRVKVQAAYGSDVDRVRAALMAVAGEVEGVCADPEPRVRFRSFGDSGLDFELLCWIDEPVLQGRTLDALNTATYKRFAAEGIGIPFPQRDLWVREVPAPRRGEGPAEGGDV